MRHSEYKVAAIALFVVTAWQSAWANEPPGADPLTSYAISLIDLNDESERQIVVDREANQSPTAGDWVAWIGTYDDLVAGRPGQHRVRLKDNLHGADCAYPGVEVLPDGTILAITYGHWGPPDTYGKLYPYILCVRLTLDELDAKATKKVSQSNDRILNSFARSAAAMERA